MGSFSGLHWAWYAFAFALFMLNVVIRAYRWHTLLRALYAQPLFAYLVYLYFVGFFANNFIPSGFGSDFVKVISLRRAYGRGTDALSSVTMDRLVGLLGSALLALLALVWNSGGRITAVSLPTALWITIAVLAVGVPVSFLGVRWANPLPFLAKRLPAIQRLPKYDKLTALLATVNQYSWTTLLRALAVSLLFSLSLIIVQFCVARALAVDLPLAVFALFVPIIAVISLIPFSFNGLGVRGGIYLFLFTPLGVSEASALAMSLAFYFLRLIAAAIGGLLYAWQSMAELSKE
jgi:uncharacterized protein (TIRG00374 family)